MKKSSLVVVLGAVLAVSSLSGCASVKDENEKVVGTCFGLSCALRAAFNANHIDTKTGLMEGNIPLGHVGGTDRKDAAADGQQKVEPATPEVAASNTVVQPDGNASEITKVETH